MYFYHISAFSICFDLSNVECFKGAWDIFTIDKDIFLEINISHMSISTSCSVLKIPISDDTKQVHEDLFVHKSKNMK